MRHLAKIAVLCSLLGALALAGAGDAGARARMPAGDPATVSFIGITTRGNERTAEHFNPTNTATIVVKVSWRTLVGHHRQRVELITPDGSIYQQFTTDVASSSGRAVVKTPVRVAGTWMTEYQMFGEWTVNVYIDDSTRPVTSGHFTLSH